MQLASRLSSPAQSFDDLPWTGGQVPAEKLLRNQLKLNVPRSFQLHSKALAGTHASGPRYTSFFSQKALLQTWRTGQKPYARYRLAAQHYWKSIKMEFNRFWIWNLWCRSKKTWIRWDLMKRKMRSCNVTVIKLWPKTQGSFFAMSYSQNMISKVNR